MNKFAAARWEKPSLPSHHLYPPRARYARYVGFPGRDGEMGDIDPRFPLRAGFIHVRPLSLPSVTQRYGSGSVGEDPAA